MKMIKTRKCLCAFIAFILLCSSLSACGGEANRAKEGRIRLDSVSKNESEAEHYVSSHLELPEEHMFIEKAFPYKEGFLLSGRINFKTPYIYYCNADGGKASSFDVSRLDTEQGIQGLAASEDGALYALICTYKNKEFVSYSLYKFSENGEAGLVSDLPFGENVSVTDMLMANGELYLNCTEYPAQTHFLAICSLQGEIIEKKDAGGFFEFASDGKNVFLGIRSPEGITLCRYERAKNALSKLEKFNKCRLLAVNGSAVYLGDATSILSYDMESGSLNRIFDWLDAGMNANVGKLIVLSSGDILLKSTENIALLKKGSEPQAEKRDIVIAVKRNLGEFTDVVINFNESNAKYHVKLVDYSSNQDPGMKLAAEFVSGKAPDIVDISAFSGDIAGEKNFEDLTKYFDNDSDISQEDLLPAPLDAMKSAGGQLFGIAPSFGIWTFLTSGQNVPEKGFSSVAESLKAMGSPNEAFGNLPRDYLLAFAFSCSGTDSYSEEDIALILEYAKELPTEYNHIEGALIPKYIADNFSDPHSLFLFSHTFFGENPEDMALFGMPFRAEKSVITSSCTLGIPRSANNKEGAWEFIKFLLLSEQDGRLYSGFCPILKAGCEKRAEVLREGIDRGTASVNGIKITDYSCLDKFDALLNEPCVFYETNSKAFEIVVTNAEPYFAGHITASKAAADIARTLKLYYSEQG